LETVGKKGKGPNLTSLIRASIHSYYIVLLMMGDQPMNDSKRPKLPENKISRYYYRTNPNGVKKVNHESYNGMRNSERMENKGNEVEIMSERESLIQWFPKVVNGG